MYSLLIAIIYVAFISLGLPDSLIGSGWPVMHGELSVPVSYAGIITMIISAGTIVSSLFSDKLTRKFGAGLVTAVSVLMTAAALFGFSVSDSFIFLCVWSIPYGLGAGAVDAALNNYVALHYSSRVMSWLHCFWGVGASISPYIMSFCLTKGLGWHIGYRSVSVIQVVLTAVLFLSLPMWKKGTGNEQDGEKAVSLTIPEIFRIKGVPQVLVTFFCYCSLEQTTGIWASSYLSQYKGIDVNTAARFASLFFGGITLGRFLCGFIADKLGDRMMIRLGIITAGIGVLLVMLPGVPDIAALAGLLVIGFGCAPIYPSVIHQTPFYFGKERSQSIIGIQMACAYVGTTLMPPFFGALSSILGLGLYPYYLIFFVILMMIMSEILNRKVKL